MIAALSPAKNLDLTPSAIQLRATQPAFMAEAESLMKTTRGLSQAKIRELLNLSQDLAKLNYDRYRSFELPFSEANALPAALAFNGDVYRGLDARDLSARQLDWAQEHIAILSGLYGILRPLDLMQAYRLEMGTRLPTRRGKNLYEFWGESITKTLKKDLAAVKGTTLVNLASDEYAKALQLDKLGVEVVNVKFLQKDAGKEKFISFFAKRARGLMARWMSTDRPSKPADLSGFNLEGYRIKKSASSENELVFVRPKPAAKKKAG